MNARDEQHFHSGHLAREVHLKELPADPDTDEFCAGGKDYAALMVPPDQWMWIPTG